MSDWWPGFVNWLGTLRWGSVPEWFAAIGTVGAFAVTLVILISDRREKRVESAASFVGWYRLRSAPRSEADGSGAFTNIYLQMHNAGNMPIRSVTATVVQPDRRTFMLKTGRLMIDRTQAERHQVRSGDTVHFSFEANRYIPISFIMVQFSDWRGRIWTRNLSTQALGDGQLEKKMMKPKSLNAAPLPQLPDWE